MSLGRTPIEKLSPADQINALARRHLELTFNPKAGKGDPAIVLAERPNANGKYVLTFGPAAVAEIERAYKPMVSDGSHYIKTHVGDAMAHFDDYLGRKAGVTSKQLAKVVRNAEAERLEQRSMDNLLARKPATSATPA